MQFLASELNEGENQEEYSRFQIIPCPMEKTVSYGAGTSGGPKAILEASQELERSSICEQGIFTQQEIDCSVCLLYTSPSPRDRQKSRMPSSA